MYIFVHCTYKKTNNDSTTIYMYVETTTPLDFTEMNQRPIEYTIIWSHDTQTPTLQMNTNL